MWLDYKGIPVDWSIPFGLFIDIHSKGEIPIDLTLNYRFLF